ncbi:hypothetical protein QVZ43_02030 [Marinobacter sp. chi1]|uniref:MarR family transcriptional regulator n=1 Tax=Marinobacter suaedae TaxID=3057675 RepID=A0ABT8VX24_9GAMM|nr:hypothetical protein [Marinobacter sp. chi1]MDO3720480.1 hypothetical protein [Marinobacter sp. chi1]
MTETHDSPPETPCLPGGLIPMDEWEFPELSVRRSVKDAVRHIAVQLRGGVSRKEQPFQSLDDLPELSASQRQRIAPDPDFSALAAAISEALRERREEVPNPRDVAFLVAPPFSGMREALVRWSWSTIGQGQGDGSEWVIAPPKSLLMSESEAVQWWDEQDLSRPWVIPELADFWLRHMGGLALVQELLRRVSAGTAGRGVVGCSSWCWQFWASYVPDIPAAPCTPAPLNSEYLGQWLTYLAGDDESDPVVARMAHDGLYVLPARGKLDGKKIRHSGFLSDLAAASRGNHGVALALWRSALRAAPEEGAGDSGDSEPSRSRSCWVVPLDKLSLPAMPPSKDRAIGFVLHALLLHDGLDEQSLRLVAGISRQDTTNALVLLKRADIIHYRDAGNRWHVTDLAYPNTRRHLQSWGFPVDRF